MRRRKMIDITDVIDITKVDRQEAYAMYIRGEITREQMYDYLHERIMYLNGFRNE